MEAYRQGERQRAARLDDARRAFADECATRSARSPKRTYDSTS